MKKEGKQGSFQDHLRDVRIKEWYEEMCYKGSELTAKVYIRRISNFEKKTGISHSDLIAKYDKETLYQILMKFAKSEKAENKTPSYIHSELKSLYSWLKFNRVDFEKIPNPKGVGTTPTLKNEVIPTSDQLRKIFLNAPNERDRVAASIMAFSGLRPSVLGNFNGTNGLKIKDMPDIIISDGEVGFKEIPALIKVQDDLSKTNHDYITFLCKEGCEYLRNYLTNRIKSGEILTPETPIIKSEFEKKNFIATKSLTSGIRRSIRNSGLNFRPYNLRRYFASRLLECENKNEIPHTFTEFMMGHTGSMFSVYAINKGLLPSQIKDLRESYSACEKYLDTTTPSSEYEEKFELTFKKRMLSFIGVYFDEKNQAELEAMTDEDIMDRFKKLITNSGNGNGNTIQKVLDVEEGEKYIENGWEYVDTLPNGKMIVRSYNLE